MIYRVSYTACARSPPCAYSSPCAIISIVTSHALFQRVDAARPAIARGGARGAMSTARRFAHSLRHGSSRTRDKDIGSSPGRPCP